MEVCREKNTSDVTFHRWRQQRPPEFLRPAGAGGPDGKKGIPFTARPP